MKVLQVYPMLKTASITNRSGFFEMPVGSEVVQLVRGEEGPALMVLAPPNALRVAHLVVYAAVDEELLVPAGKEAGKCLGLYALDQVTIIAIFPVMPWPTADQVLDAMPIGGRG